MIFTGDAISPALHSRHWLPVCERVRFNLAVLMRQGQIIGRFVSLKVRFYNSAVLNATLLFFAQLPLFGVHSQLPVSHAPPRARSSSMEIVFRSKLKTHFSLQSTSHSPLSLQSSFHSPLSRQSTFHSPLLLQSTSHSGLLLTRLSHSSLGPASHSPPTLSPVYF